jgi:CrcB protein
VTSDPPPPEDPDAPVERPLHARPGLILLVGAGGAIGTAIRATVAALAPADAWPWTTWAVNVTGAFLLGLLLDVLARTGPDDGRRRAARLVLGTGLLGGYTTYSTLALDAVMLTGSGHAVVALAYAVSTLLTGLVAAAAGIALGAHTARGRAVVRPQPRPDHAGRPS